MKFDFSQNNVTDRPLILGDGGKLGPLFPIKYVPLAFNMAILNLKQEASQNYLGVIWWFLNPLFFMFIYYFLAVIIFKSRTEDFIPFLLIGLVMWRWTALSVQQAGASIFGHVGLMRQTYLPKFVFPLSVIIDNLVKFSISLLILFAVILSFGIEVTSAYLYLPVLLLIQFIVIISCGYLLAIIVPFIPDVRLLVGFVFQAGVFLSGVLWDRSHLPENYHFFFDINPMATLIEAYRTVLLKGGAPDFGLLWPLPIAFSCLFILALVILAYLDRVFPKISG